MNYGFERVNKHYLENDAIYCSANSWKSVRVTVRVLFAHSHCFCEYNLAVVGIMLKEQKKREGPVWVLCHSLKNDDDDYIDITSCGF